ncbi:MAG: VanZ family protein [Hyphomonas sp.]|nr:VanZ family protein [Hyphomonas sp.]
MTALIRHPLIRGLAALSAFGLAVLIAVYSLVPASQAPAPSVSDKVKHFAAYAALAAPLWVALGPGMRRAATAFALAVLFGIGLELAQMLGTAGREGSALDVAANMGGAVAGLACVWMAGRNWPLFRSDSG